MNAGTIILKLLIKDGGAEQKIKRDEKAVNKFGKTGKTATKKVETGFKKVGRSAEISGQKAKASAAGMKAGALVAVAGFYSLYRIFSKLIDKQTLQEKAMQKVRQGVKSTGKAAGFTADELFKIASGLQAITTIGDEEILNGVTAQLLTFTNIANEQFKKAQMAVLDLATVLDGDLKSASIQLGKALNDPIANLSALSRSGIQFTKQQKEVIKVLWQAGEAAEAQDIILKELNKQYGGQAEAQAKLNSGVMKQFGNLLGDIAEKAGELILNGITPLIKILKPLAEAVLNLTAADFTQFIAQLGAIAAGFGAIKLAFFITSIGGLAPALELAGTGLGVFGLNIRALGTAINSALGPIGWIAVGVGTLIAAFEIYDHTLGKVVEVNKAALKSFYDFQVRDFSNIAIPELEKKIPQFEKSLKKIGAKLEQFYREVEAGEREATDENIKELEARYRNTKANLKKVKAVILKEKAFRGEINSKMSDEEIKEQDRRMEYDFKTNRISLNAYIKYLESRKKALRESLGAESVEYKKHLDKITELHREQSAKAAETLQNETRMKAEIRQSAQTAEIIDTTEAERRKKESENQIDNEAAAQALEDLANNSQAALDVLDYFGQEEQAERDRRAMEKKKTLAKNLKVQYAELKAELDSGKIKKEEYRTRLLALQNYEKEQTKKIELEQKKRSEIEKIAAVGRALYSTYEMATKAYNALAGIPLVGPALGIAAAAAATIYGLRNVSRIRATAFAKGGKVDQETVGLIGETGEPEIIAPEKSFIDVVKELAIKGAFNIINEAQTIKQVSTTQAAGSLSSGAYAVDGATFNTSGIENLIGDLKQLLAQIRDSLSDFELRAEIDPEELAIIVSKGNAILGIRDF